MNADEIAAFSSYHAGLSPHGLQKIHSILQYHFQQSINCCQVTALSYGFNVLGFKVSPDDIFSALELDIDTVIREGLTLAETHEMALRFISKSRLPVFVDAYHFDDHLQITADELWEVCNRDFAQDESDVLILNFHTGVTHGRPDGGGHFSVLAGTVQGARELVVSDVHPLKYGSHWAASVDRLRDAMADRDSSGRARGLLRLGRTDQPVRRSLGSIERANSVVNWLAPAAPYKAGHFSRYIPNIWKSHVGAMNMEGISAVALACRILGEPSQKVSSIDEIMRSLSASYTQELNRFSSTDHIKEFFDQLSKRQYVRSKAFVVPLPDPLDGKTLRELLAEAGSGSGKHAVLLPYDLGVAFNNDVHLNLSSETNVLSHGTRSWGVVADFDKDAGPDDDTGMVVASAHNVDAVGRLWYCSFNRFAAAIKAAEGRSAVVVTGESLDDQRTKLERILSILDRNHSGTLSAEDLYTALTGYGLRLTMEDARKIIHETAFEAGETLDHAQAIETLVHALAMRPEYSRDGHPKQAILREFLEAHGCFDNNLGFATTHLALLTANVRDCVAFYNGIFGWPLYKTVDRAHAGAKIDELGSSWASFGAFASFTVFHLWDVPPGREGHGPWASENDLPPVLHPAYQGQRSIPFQNLPFPFLGVVLSQSFYERQMAHALSKAPDLVWAEIDDASGLLGEQEVSTAIVFRDPDGYPFVLFVSALSDADYRAKYPVAPFVYGTNIRAASKDLEQEQEKIHGDLSHIATCPVIASYRRDPEKLPLVERWLATHAYGKDSLDQHERYYQDIMGCEMLSKTMDPRTKITLTQYKWDKHFLLTRTNINHFGAMAGGDEGHHNMGGNKGEVLVPHYGLNIAYEKFATLRKSVQTAMKRHGVPQDLCVSFSKMGHAPARNLLDSFHLLFADDPDTCLSMFVCDPSGNMNEIKWYMDFGEMFKEQGDLGMDGVRIDNSLVADHFPPEVLAMMERRGIRGDQEGREVLASEQAEAENG